MQIPAAAIGAVIAALIGGIVSLLGLIISKEQKISEFRQAWIDDLRENITLFLSALNAVSDAENAKFKDDEERVKFISPLYRELNESHFYIVLRLNTKEDHHSALLGCLDKFHSMFGSGVYQSRMIRPVEEEFLRNAKSLLKIEWEVVKRGEPTFRIAKALAAIVIFAAVLAALFFGTSIGRHGEKAAQTSVVSDERVGSDNHTTKIVQPAIAVQRTKPVAAPTVAPEAAQTANQSN